MNLFPENKQPVSLAEEMKLSVSGSATYGKDDLEELNWVKSNLSIAMRLTLRSLNQIPVIHRNQERR